MFRSILLSLVFFQVSSLAAPRYQVCSYTHDAQNYFYPFSCVVDIQDQKANASFEKNLTDQVVAKCQGSTKKDLCYIKVLLDDGWTFHTTRDPIRKNFQYQTYVFSRTN